MIHLSDPRRNASNGAPFMRTVVLRSRRFRVAASRDPLASESTPPGLVTASAVRRIGTCRDFLSYPRKRLSQSRGRSVFSKRHASGAADIPLVDRLFDGSPVAPMATTQN
jgi:hypothetical protein